MLPNEQRQFSSAFCLAHRILEKKPSPEVALTSLRLLMLRIYRIKIRFTFLASMMASLPRSLDRCKELWWVCLFICLSVWLSVCLCLSVHSHNLKNTAELHQFLCTLTTAVARSSSDGVAIHHVLPMLWMTSRFHTMGPTARIKHDVMFKWVR